MKLDQLVNILESKDEAKKAEKAPSMGADDVGDTVSTATAAKELGVTPSRIRQLKAEGRVKATEPTPGRPESRIRKKELAKLKKEDRTRTGRPKGS